MRMKTATELTKSGAECTDAACTALRPSRCCMCQQCIRMCNSDSRWAGYSDVLHLWSG